MECINNTRNFRYPRVQEYEFADPLSWSEVKQEEIIVTAVVAQNGFCLTGCTLSRTQSTCTTCRMTPGSRTTALLPCLTNNSDVRLQNIHVFNIFNKILSLPLLCHVSQETQPRSRFFTSFVGTKVGETTRYSLLLKRLQL